MDPRVQDTLCERELQFPPYDAPELENILEARAEIAIVEDAIEQGVSNFCAALAARDSGSARQALDLLRLAGEIAENREADVIKHDHVEAARSRLEQERVEEGMRELTTHGRLALLAVISKAAKEETPCRTRGIYEEYITLCDSSGTDSLAQRSVHNHLSDLRMLGILSAYENRSGSRGNYYSYELDVPVWEVRKRVAFQRAFSAGNSIFGYKPELDMTEVFLDIAATLDAQFDIEAPEVVR